MGNISSNVDTSKIQTAISDLDNLVEDWEVVAPINTEILQLDTLILDINDLSVLLEEALRTWRQQIKQQNKLCADFKGTIEKLCEDVDQVIYLQDEIIKPLISWLEQRKSYLKQDRQLVYPDDAKFMINGLKYILNYLTTVLYFAQKINSQEIKLETTEKLVLDAYVKRVTYRLIG